MAVKRKGPPKEYGGMTKKQLQMLLDNDMMDLVLKHGIGTAAANAPVQGSGGIFSEAGVNPNVYSAIVRPNTFLGAIPLVQTMYSNELTTILTAQAATAGTNPTSIAGDPVTPGLLQKATIARRLATMFIGSNPVDVSSIGLLQDRADQERIILNAASANPLIPDILARGNVNFRSEAAHQLFRLGLAAERAMASIAVAGNSALTDTSATRGWLREFDGLDRIVTGGITDVSGIRADAADSLVVNWGTTLGATGINGKRFGRALYEAIYSRLILAMNTGIPVTRWALVMDRRLFIEAAFELAAYYVTVKLSDASSSTPQQREMDVIEQRYNAMVNGLYLTIGDLNMPVLFTDGTEVSTGSGGTLSASLYFVALEEAGTPITYLEYFPMNNNFIDEFNALSNTTNRSVLNNGLYMLAARSTGFTDQLLLTAKLRLMCRAPFLCARLDGIVFNSPLGIRVAQPGLTQYFNGGVSTYTRS